MRSVTIGRLILFALIPIRLLAQTADLSGIIFDPSGLPVPKAKISVKANNRRNPRSRLQPARPIQHTRAPARLLRRHGGGDRIQIHASKRNRPGSGPARPAGFHPRHRQHLRNHHGRRERAAAQHVRCIGEHRHRQPVRREHAPERPQLQLADRTRAGRRADAGQSLRAGPVQRQWPAAGRELFHGGWSQRQSRKRRKRRPALSGRRRPASSTNAFGGTSNLVSLDALEEFRIQTSTFAPEYGRTPGAQISVVTKSGTNAFPRHGLRVFPQRQAGCQRLVRQRQGSGEARTAAERFRRRAGRADQEGQALLLRLV